MLDKKSRFWWLFGFLLFFILPGCGNVTQEEEEAAGSVMVNGVHYASDAVNAANIYGKLGSDAVEDDTPPLGLEDTCVSSHNVTKLEHLELDGSEIKTYINSTVKLQVRLRQVETEGVQDSAVIMWKIVRGDSPNDNASIEPTKSKTDSNGISTINFIAGTGISSYYVYAFNCNAKDGEGNYVPVKFHIFVKGAPHLPSDDYHEGSLDLENDLSLPVGLNRCADVENGTMESIGPTNLQAFVDQEVQLTLKGIDPGIKEIYWKRVRGDKSINDGHIIEKGGKFSKEDIDVNGNQNQDVFISDVVNGAATIKFYTGHAYNTRYFVNAYNCADPENPVVFQIDTYILPETMGEKGDSVDLSDLDGDGKPDGGKAIVGEDGKIIGIDLDGDTIPDIPSILSPNDIDKTQLFYDYIITDPNDPGFGKVIVGQNPDGSYIYADPEDIYFIKDPETGKWYPYYKDENGEEHKADIRDPNNPDKSVDFTIEYTIDPDTGVISVIGPDGKPVKIDTDGDGIPDAPLTYTVEENEDGNIIITDSAGNVLRPDVDGDGIPDDVVIILDENGNVIGYDLDGDGIPDMPASNTVPGLSEEDKKDFPQSSCNKSGGFTIDGGKLKKLFILSTVELKVKLPAAYNGDKVKWVVARGASKKNDAVIGDGTEYKSSKEYFESDNYKPSGYISEVKDGVATATFYSGTAYDATYMVYAYSSCSDVAPVAFTVKVIYGLGIPVNEGDSPTENDITPPDDIEAYQSALGDCFLDVVPGNKSNFTMVVAKTVYLDVLLRCPNSKKSIKYQQIHWTMVRGASVYNNASLGAAKTKVNENGISSNEFFSGMGYNSLYYVNAFHSNAKLPATFTIKIDNFTGGGDPYDPNNPNKPTDTEGEDPNVPPVVDDNDGKPVGGGLIGPDGKCQSEAGCVAMRIVGKANRRVAINAKETISVEMRSFTKGQSFNSGKPVVNAKIDWTYDKGELATNNGYLESKASRTDDMGVASVVFATGSGVGSVYRINAYNKSIYTCKTAECKGDDKELKRFSVDVTTISDALNPNKVEGNRGYFDFSAKKTSRLEQSGVTIDKVKYYVFENLKMGCNVAYANQSKEKLDGAGPLASKEVTGGNFAEVFELQGDKIDKISEPLTIYAVGFDSSGKAQGYQCLDNKKFPSAKKPKEDEPLRACSNDRPCASNELDTEYYCHKTYVEDEEGVCKKIVKSTLKLEFDLNPLPLEIAGTYEMKSTFNFGSMLLDGPLGDELRKFLGAYSEFLGQDPAGTLTDLMWDSIFKKTECEKNFCGATPCAERCGELKKKEEKYKFMKPVLKIVIDFALDSLINKAGVGSAITSVTDAVQFLDFIGTITLDRATSTSSTYNGKVVFTGLGITFKGKSLDFNTHLSGITGTFSGATLVNNYNQLKINKFQFNFSYGMVIYDLLFKHIFNLGSDDEFGKSVDLAKLIPCDKLPGFSILGISMTEEGVRSACKTAAATLTPLAEDFAAGKNISLNIEVSGSATLERCGNSDNYDADEIVNGEWTGTGKMKGKTYTLDGVWTAYRSGKPDCVKDYPVQENLGSFINENSIGQAMIDAVLGESKPAYNSNLACLNGNYEGNHERSNSCKNSDCRTNPSIVVCTPDGKLNSAYKTAGRDRIIKDANAACKNKCEEDKCKDNPEITVCGGGTNEECLNKCGLSNCSGNAIPVCQDGKDNAKNVMYNDPATDEVVECENATNKLECYITAAKLACEENCDDSCANSTEMQGIGVKCSSGSEEEEDPFVPTSRACMEDCRVPGCEATGYCYAHAKCGSGAGDKCEKNSAECYICVDDQLKANCTSKGAVGSKDFIDCLILAADGISPCITKDGKEGDACCESYESACKETTSYTCQSGKVVVQECDECSDNGVTCTEYPTTGGEVGSKCNNETYKPNCDENAQDVRLNCKESVIIEESCFSCEAGECKDPTIGASCVGDFSICDLTSKNKKFQCVEGSLQLSECVSCAVGNDGKGTVCSNELPEV